MDLKIPTLGKTKWAQKLEPAFSATLLALLVTGLFLLIFGSYCIFTNKKWAIHDYGAYTNMIYNCGRGDWFRYLVDRNYLDRHLSFSLALFGPLFRVWDSPLVLMFVQWAMFCGGCCFVGLSCLRHGLPRVVTLAVLCLYTWWPFTQSVLLTSFHGVSAYLLLLPWLYHASSFNRKWTFLPLLLLLGLREEACLFGIPILLYVAVRDRWRSGYVYAAVSLLYGIVAVFALYPWINGRSLFERRSAEVGGPLLGGLLTAAGFKARAWGLLFVVLPLLPLVRRGVWRVGVIAFLPVFISMASGFSRQHQLTNHYPAVVMAAIIVGIVAALGTELSKPPGSGFWRNPTTLAVVMVLLTMGAHRAHGFLYLGARYEPRTLHADPSGPRILDIARKIPKQGVLLVPDQIGGAFGNRADFLGWNQYEPDRHKLDLVFFLRKDWAGRRGEPFRADVSNGVFHIRYEDSRYVIVERVKSSW